MLADSAGGVALGALLELVRTGAIGEGEQVVLVVTGSGLKPYAPDRDRPRPRSRDVDSLLAALGVEEGLAEWRSLPGRDARSEARTQGAFVSL